MSASDYNTTISHENNPTSIQDGMIASPNNLDNNDDEITPLLTTNQCGDGQQEGEEKPYVLDDVLSQIPFGKFHWLMLCLIGGGYFAVCSEMMLFIYLSEPVKKEWDLSKYNFPWLPFSTGLAGIIAGYVAGVLSDRHGRRIPFLIGMSMVSVFGFVSAVAPSFPSFIALRCMVTAGNGVFETVGFVYMLEFLPRARRGTIIVVVTMCGTMGAVFAAGMAWAVLPTWGWRWYVGACAVPTIAVLLFQPLAFYETPRVLFMTERKDKAEGVLRQIARMNKWQMPSLDGMELPKNDKSTRGNVAKLFSRDLQWQTFIFSTIWFLEATGYWGVTVYLPEYMDKMGINPYFNMFAIFIGEIPGLLLAMYLIEKKSIGRTGCLRLFSATTAVSLIVFSFIPTHVMKTIMIMLCYCAMVPIYSILNAFTPEIYPTHVRSTAMAWMNTIIEVPGLATPFAGATLLSSDIPWLYPLVWASLFVLQFIATFGIRFDSVGENLKESKSVCG